MSKLRRQILWALLAGVIAAVVMPATAVQSADVPKNILVIGWDGAQRDHVKECLQRKELPTLQKLADEGTLVEIDVEGTTDTKAGWSQILTGCYPEITGVYSNGRYQPIPEGCSVFERLQQHFGKDKIATIAVIGKKGHVDADPPQKIKVAEAGEKPAAKPRPKAKPGRAAKPGKQRKPEGTIVEENGVKYRVVPGKPHYNWSRNVDFFQNGLMEDDKVGTLAIEILKKYQDKPIFAFIHFASVDHMGHRHGENSKEYTDALISNDTQTGKIIDAIKQMGQYDKTLIYVVADHGFDEGGSSHHDAPYTSLGTNDKKVIRNGLRQDIAPTVLERFGVDLSKIEPPLDGVPLTRPCERKNVVLGPASPHSGRQPREKPAGPARKKAKRKAAAAAAK